MFDSAFTWVLVAGMVVNTLTVNANTILTSEPKLAWLRSLVLFVGSLFGGVLSLYFLPDEYSLTGLIVIAAGYSFLVSDITRPTKSN